MKVDTKNMGEALDRLELKLAGTWVPGYDRVKDGKVEHVDGYWREIPTSVSVVDTRTWEEGDDDKWHPIPGSGDPRPCDRCGKQHEIHVTVTYPSKSLCVGTTCATDPEAPFVKKAVATEKTRMKLVLQLAKLEAQLKEFDSARTQVDGMMMPPVEGPFESSIGVEYRMGDANVYTHEGLNEERLSVLQDGWKTRRLAELTPIRYRHYITDQIERIERRLKSIEKKKQAADG